MSIDTYVYFVSFTIYSRSYKQTNANMAVVYPKEIKCLKDIRDVEKLILDDGFKAQRQDVKELALINFQLLDSYNKEEREAKENEEINL